MKKSVELPRLAFVGVGWIGRHRMEAALRHGVGQVIALADAAPDAREAARELAPNAIVAESLEAILEQRLPLDAVVIATPSARHAAECELAIEHGLHVFCQKPLGRNAAETARVVAAARARDRSLGVDFSYRFTDALRKLHPLVSSNELGRVFAVRLVFHNAYGPDKPWFYDRAQSGGGAVIDLGVHLVDAALWTLGFPRIEAVHSRLYSGGRLLGPDPVEVEDYAVAQLELASGTVVELACSWNLQAGQDAIISAEFFGTDGGAAMRNVNGSFYDFVAERYRKTTRETLASPPDEWGGRALVDWLEKLVERPHFDASSLELVEVANAIDRIYGRRVDSAATHLRPAAGTPA